jgi:hypothetical protein
MKLWKVTYFHPKSGHQSIYIEAETEEEATKQFMFLVVDGHEIGYCKTE